MTNLIKFLKNTKLQASITMRSRIITEWRLKAEVVAEKIMEWIEFLHYKVKRRKEYSSNLVEVYTIKKECMLQEFVSEFLRARSRVIEGNRYRMIVNTCEGNGNEEEIGKVSLYRKKNLIQEARLITKPRETDKEKLIYWKFD